MPRGGGGRFNKELLLFYVAGIPTYVLMGELATGVLLAGVLPKPDFPEALRKEARRRWHADAVASLGYAAAALRSRSDLAIGLANATRALIEQSHAVLAGDGQWVLNEKGIVAQAGLSSHAELLLGASDAAALLGAVEHIRSQIEAK